MLTSSEQWIPCEVLRTTSWLYRPWDRAETSPVGAPWCLYLQSGLIFFLIIFFVIKIDFFSGAFATPLHLVFFSSVVSSSIVFIWVSSSTGFLFVSICLKVFGSVVLFG